MPLPLAEVPQGSQELLQRPVPAAQTPQAKQVLPGPEEQALVEQYRNESSGLTQRLAPLKSDINRLEGEMGDISASMPATPKLETPPDYQPNRRDGDEMMLFAGIAMALSAIGGRAAGADIATVMNTAGAAMDGFAKGDAARMKSELETFNTQKNAILAKNDQMLKEYQAVLADRRTTMEQKMQQYRVVAAKYQDEIAESAIKKGDLKFELDRLDKLRNATNQFNQRAQQISSTLEGRLVAATSRTDRGGPMSLTQDAITDTAHYVLLNGRLPIGFARMGQEAQQAILNRVSEVARAAGMTSEELAAAGPLTKQKLGAYLQFEKMRNSIQAYEKMLDLNIDVLKDLSAKVNRSGSPYANKPILWLQQNAAGDPDVAEYLFQVRTVQTEAARILSNPNLTGQLTDTATQELANVMGANLTHEQLTGVLNRAQADARNRAQSIDEQSQKIIAEIRDPLKRNAGGGGAPVQRSTSKSGRPIVSKDGGKTWEYE